MNWNDLLSEKRFVEHIDEDFPSHRTDYDTIICSTLFRRLQDKAQVFPLDDDDYVRTRLTHSLEVSAIGKKLGECAFAKAKEAGLDPWFEEHLVEMELSGKPITEVLSDWQLQDLYTFEGNAQSIRLLSKTPYLGTMNGFNLSYPVLGTIMKYPISSEKLAQAKREIVSGTASTLPYKKIGYNYSERELFDTLNEVTGMNGRRHPLSFLLEAADDIAYRTSDVEDSLVKKVLGITQIFIRMRLRKKTESRSL